MAASCQKKSPNIVDKLTSSEQKRLQRIKQAQELFGEVHNISVIAKIMGLDSRTVSKYLQGDPENLCHHKKRSSLYTIYHDEIVQWLKEGCTASNIYRKLTEKGVNTSCTNARNLANQIAKEQDIRINKYIRSESSLDKSKAEVQFISVTRGAVFNHIWYGEPLSTEKIEYVCGNYGAVSELDTCVREFRDIFNKHSLSRLYAFIEKYSQSSQKEIASFAKGLNHDLEAVEEAVTSKLSNGFVEGINSKLKMIKHTMFGRCGKELLAAKLILDPSNFTIN